MEKKSPILSIVVLLVIVTIAVGVLFLVFKPADSSVNTDNTGLTGLTTVNPEKPDTNPEVTATTKPLLTPVVSTVVSATPTTPALAGCETVAAVNAATPPSNWKVLDNTKQGYTVYRPTGFYYRLFPPDMFVLGIDPNPIPTASEYMGVINMIRLSASSNFDTYLGNLEAGYKTCTREIDGRTWTTVVGKTKTTDAFEGKYVKYGKVTVGGKDFMARLENQNANYGGYADEYEIFITTIVFK